MTEGMEDLHEPELQDRVLRALSLRDEGAKDWLEQACGSDTTVREDVLRAVAEADALPGILTEAYGADSRLGSVIAGRYRVHRRLGAGAMGVVYEAEDFVLERRVALKVLRSGLLDRERADERFDREARAMARVNHPSVLSIHDRGFTEDRESFLVVELVDGRDLSEFVERLAAPADSAPIPTRRELERGLGFQLETPESYIRLVVRWVAELADGLAEAHTAGVLHRDVKPSNVLVRTDGRAVLLDFGVATQNLSAELQRDESSVGTPAFLDPELLEPGARATVQSDVYGLASVLYNLLALKPPYQGTATGVLRQIATQPPEPLSSLNPLLPRDLVAVVEMGMHRRARGRYKTAAAFRDDLRAFLEHLPLKARPSGPLRRARLRLRRSRSAQTLLATLAVLAILASGFLLRAHLRETRQAEWLELSRSFPPNFTIVNPENRVLVAASDRDDLEALLDRAADVALDPLPTVLLRASFHLDHGNAAGAARDMRTIAQREQTPFAAKLAEAYSALPADAAGSAALDLTDLPEPQTLRDRYLRAYHHLRAFEDAAALELMDGELRLAIPHAEELRFALVELGRYEPLVGPRRALELHTDVLRLEERMGARTAATAHFAAYALSHANAYQQALEVGLEGVALAPRSHVNRTTVGWAAFSFNRQAAAREHLNLASELRPNDPKPAWALVQSYVAEGDFDRALETIEQRGPLLSRVPAWWAAETAAEVETYRALGIGSESPLSAEERGAAILRARNHLDRVREQLPENATGYSSAFVESALDALESGDEQALTEVLATEFALDVRRLWRLPVLRRHLPEQLAPGPTTALERLLESLESELAGTRAQSRPRD